jgi:hypothetical protein
LLSQVLPKETQKLLGLMVSTVSLIKGLLVVHVVSGLGDLVLYDHAGYAVYDHLRL